MNCSKHGNQKYGLVCQHLLTGKKELGFWEPFDSKSDIIYSDGELNAWCNDCDKILTQEGTWNDKAESHAHVQVVCRLCYFEIKKDNKLNPNNNG